MSHRGLSGFRARLDETRLRGEIAFGRHFLLFLRRRRRRNEYCVIKSMKIRNI